MRYFPESTRQGSKTQAEFLPGMSQNLGGPSGSVTGRGVAPGSPLVYKSISQQHPKQPRRSGQNSSVRTLLTLGSTGGDDGRISSLRIYRNQVTAKRNLTFPKPENQGKDRLQYLRQYFKLYGKIPLHPQLDEFIRNQKKGAKRGKIDSFSVKSRKNLKFKAENCYPFLTSQFLCSFRAGTAPKDGRELKRIRNNFLTLVRRRLGNPCYLWILEFTTTYQTPHFHLYLNLPVSTKIRKILAGCWIQAVSPSSDELREAMWKVHDHHENFIPWDMSHANYLTKYIEKTAQKQVPTEFESVGRFWGTSRNLEIPVENLQLAGLQGPLVDQVTGEVIIADKPSFLIRQLRRFHESQLRTYRKGRRKHSRLRNRHLKTVQLSYAAPVVNRLLHWFDQQQYRNKPETPF